MALTHVKIMGMLEPVLNPRMGDAGTVEVFNLPSVSLVFSE